MTPTEFKLMAVHKAPVIRLTEVCGLYLHWSPAYAKRKARENHLPFPCFRPTASQRSPWLVKLEDLARFIDAQTAASSKLWAASRPS